MWRLKLWMGMLCTVVLALLVAGCGSTAPEGPERDNHATDKGSHGGQSDMAKMKAELATLSPEDAVSAEKQHVCPVSGKMLGTMGPPNKVDVNGTLVWICCDGCKDELLQNADKYLADLKKE
jgi:Cu(I)/Ag(I) efflux system membrane fusion protein